MTKDSFITSNVKYTPLVSNNDLEDVPDQIKKRPHNVKTWFWIILVTLTGLLFLFDILEFQFLNLFNQFREKLDVLEPVLVPNLEHELRGYLINTPGCRIPEMNPFDASVKKFINKPNKIVCNKGVPPLFENNLTSLYILEESLPYYNVNQSDINCCYRVFWRKNPTEQESDKQVTYSETCVSINSTAVNIEEEFIKVTCTSKANESLEIYKDFFIFVPSKKKLERTTPDLTPNVLIIGLDAVSRVNFHRQMPDTYSYLSKELNAVELLGYTKVADNTFVNLVPVLTGLFESELVETCWPSDSHHFDNCSFLWHNFSQNNYVTAFGEDCAWIGMFNYQKRGFIQQTTDYYYTNFNREMESQIGSNTDFNCDHCVGGRETYAVTLDYIKKLVERMKLDNSPYFGFFWGSSLSHDYLNRPALGDPVYTELFKYLKNNGHLNNTVLIFMSDHGIRWGDIRQTYQGQMEERLPFVFIVLPEWIKNKYPVAIRNLNRNVRRLTTPFDLHETLSDFLNIDKLLDPKNIVGEQSRGFSLFNEIPINRTCQEAAIESHWCTCQQSEAVSSNDSEIIAAAHFAINNMNQLLEGYAQCATLVLDSVLNARVLSYDSKHIKDGNLTKDYTITLQTSPGGGVFEVTVRAKTGKVKRFLDTTGKDFMITGTISRLNLYGKQSYCITNFHLKLYCYCKSILNIL